MRTKTEMRFQRDPFTNCSYRNAFSWKCYNSLVRFSFVFLVITSSSAPNGYPFYSGILYLATAIFFLIHFVTSLQILFCISKKKSDRNWVWIKAKSMWELACCLKGQLSLTASARFWEKQYFRELKCILITCQKFAVMFCFNKQTVLMIELYICH